MTKKEIKDKNLIMKCDVIDNIKQLPVIDVLDIAEKSMKEIKSLNDDDSCDFLICDILRKIEKIKTYF